MKRTFLFLALLTPLKAELPQLSDPKAWWGYFVGWESRNMDYGFGADGEGIIYPKVKKKRKMHNEFKVHYRVREEVGGKWVNRSVKDWTSENKGGVNLKKPVSVVCEVTGDTKAEFRQIYSKNTVIVKPKLLEKKTDNPTRLGVEISVRDYYRIHQKKKVKPSFSDKDLKKLLKKEILSAIRIKDGKKVSLKMYETGVDILSDKMLADGASSISVDFTYLGKTLEVKQGDPKIGKFEIIPRKGHPMHTGYKILWSVTPEEAQKKGAWMSFTLR